jgi:Flp pilus assembly protein TadB
MGERGHREPRGGPVLWKWQTAVIVAITWAMATAVQWGLQTARTDENSRRIAAVEMAQSQMVSRAEFDDLRADLRDRMVRIERKLDDLSSSRQAAR